MQAMPAVSPQNSHLSLRPPRIPTKKHPQLIPSPRCIPTVSRRVLTLKWLRFMSRQGPRRQAGATTNSQRLPCAAGSKGQRADSPSRGALVWVDSDNPSCPTPTLASTRPALVRPRLRFGQTLIAPINAVGVESFRFNDGGTGATS